MNPPLQYEDQVTLLSVPMTVERDREQFPETYTLCVKAAGNVFTVRAVNDYGMAELWMNPDGTDSDSACADSLWIEPEYLRRYTRNEERL